MSFSLDDLNADYYDLRRIMDIGGTSLGVTLPSKQCEKHGITPHTVMRVIAKEGVFVVLKETDYQRFPILRRRIETLFEPVKIEDLKKE